jgi:hemerythrin-like metal-binding protein
LSAEEAAMERARYPELAAHRQEHAQFVEYVSGIQEAIKVAELVSAISLLEFLRDWLFNHILGTDRLYVPFLAGSKLR